MKTVVVALMILVSISTFAQQPPPAAKAVAFFDVTDLPARIDEPKLQKEDDNYVLRCAVANRSQQSLVGLRLTLIFVDSANGHITRTTWNEATDVAAYSIKTFDFHPRVKDSPRDTKVFLGIEEAIGSETVWRIVDVDKLLRAYARGEHGLVPKVQMLGNKFDRQGLPVIY